MTTQLDARAFGALEAEVRNLREKVEVQAGLMRDLGHDLRLVNDLLSQAKGGWKVMMMVGGVAGLIGAFFSKLISMLAVR